MNSCSLAVVLWLGRLFMLYNKQTNDLVYAKLQDLVLFISEELRLRLMERMSSILSCLSHLVHYKCRP